MKSIYIYIYYIHPELGIGDYFFRSGKGAGPLLEGASREQGRARREHEGAPREHQGSTREHRGSTEGALREH